MMWDIRLHSLLLENRNASVRNTEGWQINTTASDISLGFSHKELRNKNRNNMNYHNNGLNLGHIWYIHATSWGSGFYVSCEESSLHKSNILKVFCWRFLPLTLNAPDAVFPRLVSLFLTLVYSRSVCCVIILSRSGHGDVIQGWKLFIWGSRSFTVAL